MKKYNFLFFLPIVTHVHALNLSEKQKHFEETRTAQWLCDAKMENSTHAGALEHLYGGTEEQPTRPEEEWLEAEEEQSSNPEEEPKVNYEIK